MNDAQYIDPGSHQQWIERMVEVMPEILEAEEQELIDDMQGEDV